MFADDALNQYWNFDRDVLNDHLMISIYTLSEIIVESYHNSSE